ncbi:hypothetical protein SESBI_47404 [Sesbania bispinosa]|nr:hypothetical protein SESBI_47404 [Sesbania bispinosa]
MNCEVHLYVEHSVSVVEALEVIKELTYHNEAGRVTGHEMDNSTGDVGGNYVRDEPPSRGKEVVDDIVQEDTVGNDSDRDASDNSEESMENIYFDDSEEDMDLGLDDGFSDIDESAGDKNGEQLESSKHGSEKIKKKKMRTIHEAAPTDVIPQLRKLIIKLHQLIRLLLVKIHDIEEEYICDDLKSGDDFVVDGSERPRAGRTTTYRLKTLVRRHTCGKVFGNNNAKVSLMAKVLVNKMRFNNKVTLKEVMDDIRTAYSTGITISRAFKVR